MVALSLGGLSTTPGYPQEPTPRIELYTMGPGDDLFSKFGHAALCVVDEANGSCFNYGTADFSTPGPLAWAVLRGRGEFWVSVAPLDEMLAFYHAEDRTIYRQVLPLDREQVGIMEQALRTSALPQNRRYRYDHFFDNCSTRPRDHIDTVTRGALRATTGDIDLRFTFRALIQEDLVNHPVHFLLTEALLGRPTDRERSEYEAMFLPRVLREGVERHLAVAPQTVYNRRAPVSGPSPLVAHRLALALAIGLMGGLLIFTAPQRAASRTRWLYACFFGMVGVTAWTLALASPVPALRHNEILLVFLPADFLLCWSLTRVTLVYLNLRLASLFLVVLLFASGILIQPLGPFLSLTLPVLSATRARGLARPVGSG